MSVLEGRLCISSGHKTLFSFLKGEGAVGSEDTGTYKILEFFLRTRSLPGRGNCQENEHTYRGSTLELSEEAFRDAGIGKMRRVSGDSMEWGETSPPRGRWVGSEQTRCGLANSSN